MNQLLLSEKKLIGLIGHPVKHTYSPMIYNLVFNLKKMNYYYLAFDISPLNLKEAIKSFITLNFVGFNVTLPYKTQIIPFINRTSEEAAITGSINTVVNNQGELSGYNTDVDGFTDSLIPYREYLKDKNCTILGSGGAARTAIYCIIKYFKPNKIFLITRKLEKALTIKEIFKNKLNYDAIEIINFFSQNTIDKVQNSTLVVNTTPLGMFPHIKDSPLNSSEYFNKNQIVFDLIYNPGRTKFLEYAIEANAVAINGLNMLIKQAAKSFEIWTSSEYPVEEVKITLERTLK